MIILISYANHFETITGKLRMVKKQGNVATRIDKEYDETSFQNCDSRTTNGKNLLIKLVFDQ